MGADAELEACGFDGGEIGARQILLAEMHEVGAEIDRLTPIVVDDELAAVGRHNFECSRNLGS